MRKIILLAACFSFLYLTSAFASIAPVNSVTIPGNLKISGAGNAVVFPDGTTQSTATLQGPPGIQGPPGNPGTQGIQGVQGIQGPPGPSVSGQWLLKHWAYTNFVPAIGANPAYTQTNMQPIYYDTTGKCTGWLQTTQNGATNTPITYVSYYTDWDAHNNSIAGYEVDSNVSTPLNFTHSYTYDSDGKKTQRVKTYFDGNNNVTKTITWNYDVTHHEALASSITVFGNVTITVTYTYLYDPNGYPTLGTTATSQFNSSTNTTTNWTGTVVSEYMFFPDL